MILPNPIDEIWTNYSLVADGDISLTTESNGNPTDYVASSSETLTLTSVSYLIVPNTSLVSSVMSPCTNYLSNPFGRSSTYPYSFTQESLQDVDFSSPFWTDTGSGTSELKILELDGTQVTWLTIDPSTGNVSGKSPKIENNYTFNVELKFDSATFTVPFYLNIRKWKFSNWKVWSLESWIKCHNGYQYDEISGQCKESGNELLK